MLATTLASAAVLAATTSAGLATSPQAGKPANVRVVDLRVNGRADQPLLDVGDRSPVLAWRMATTPAAASHRCQRSGPDVACPADKQTAYQIQAANSVADLNSGNLIWDSGKVASSEQSGVPYAGSTLESREQVVWRSASGTPTARPRTGPRPGRGRWGCWSRATGATPTGSSIPAAPRASHCRSSPATSTSTARWQRPGCICPGSASSCRPSTGRR